MLEYDSSVIYEFATRLEARARGLVAVWLTGGAIAGALAGMAIAEFTGRGGGGAVLVGLAVGGVCAAGAARERAFQLRLRAHMALCQVRIEEHTRSRRP